MKIRLITQHGDGLGIAYHLKKEGHQCDFYSPSASVRRALVGIVPQVSDPSAGSDKYDLVVLDSCGNPTPLTRLATAFGDSPLSSSLELDHEFALKTAKANGMLTPDYRVCTDRHQYLEAVTESDHLWAVGVAKGQPSTLSCTPRSHDEQIMFGSYLPSDMAPAFLQEMLPGVDVVIGCAYKAGHPILDTAYSAIISRRYATGGLGPVVGFAGCVAWFWKTASGSDSMRPLPERNKLWQFSHGKMDTFLARFGYTGILQFHLTVSDADGLPHYQGLTCHPDAPIMEALASQIDGGIASLLLFWSGKLTVTPSTEWTSCTRCSIPPYPVNVDASQLSGQPVSVDETSDGVWLSDVASIRPGTLSTAGVDGVVGDVSGRGSTAANLQSDTEDRLAASIHVLDLHYRTDVVASAQRSLKRLSDLKYISYR